MGGAFLEEKSVSMDENDEEGGYFVDEDGEGDMQEVASGLSPVVSVVQKWGQKKSFQDSLCNRPFTDSMKVSRNEYCKASKVA